MDNGEMKKCPYCAEMIKAEAIKCRYCGSLLAQKSGGFSTAGAQGFWHRVSEGKKIAGVCTGLARQFDSPVMVLPLRVFFVVSTLFYFFGPILYILLWILMPAPVDELGTGRPEAVRTPGAVYPPAYTPQPPPVSHYPGQGARPDSDYAPPGMDKTPPEKAQTNGSGEKEADSARKDTGEGVLDLGRAESGSKESEKSAE